MLLGEWKNFACFFCLIQSVYHSWRDSLVLLLNYIYKKIGGWKRVYIFFILFFYSALLFSSTNILYIFYVYIKYNIVNSIHTQIYPDYLNFLDCVDQFYLNCSALIFFFFFFGIVRERYGFLLLGTEPNRRVKNVYLGRSPSKKKILFFYSFFFLLCVLRICLEESQGEVYVQIYLAYLTSLLAWE